MGGHGLKRAAAEYRAVVFLAWKLVRLGFVIATGGGPGAMEAANLGGYLCERGEAAVEDAVHLIKTSGDLTCAQEYNNKAAARVVIDKYGPTSDARSIGIPTWRYGHEPSNIFATWHAKMFQNSIREDGLIAIGSGGIVYTPGSAGTRQEVFQAACKNHYAEKGLEVPMVFFGEQYWNKCSVYDVLVKNSLGRPFAQWLKLTDDVDDIVKGLHTFAGTHGLPLQLTRTLRHFSEDVVIVAEEDAVVGTTTTVATATTDGEGQSEHLPNMAKETTASSANSGSVTDLFAESGQQLGERLGALRNSLGVRLDVALDRLTERMQESIVLPLLRRKEGRAKLHREKCRRFSGCYDDES
jgi:predicted Rossmann-fold nucleotide-binding protein